MDARPWSAHWICVGWCLCPPGQGPIPVGPLVGESLGSGGDVLEPLALLVAPVGTVAVEVGLPAMQQVGQLLAVMHVAGGDACAVDQAAVAVHADVQLHAKRSHFWLSQRRRGGNSEWRGDPVPLQFFIKDGAIIQ